MISLKLFLYEVIVNIILLYNNHNLYTSIVTQKKKFVTFVVLLDLLLNNFFSQTLTQFVKMISFIYKLIIDIVHRQ